MKKVIIFVTIFALSVLSITPALATTISTGMTQVQAGGDAPIVKAKWEANVDRYTDDSTDAGAQLMPPGVKDEDRPIAICAIVTDTDGMGDIAGVYADVFYPENIALGDSHTALPNQSGAGCGEFMQQDQLFELEKQAGWDLFCGQVRNNNYNLPTFNPSGLYDYDEICATDGELLKLTAKVYCGQKDLSYEDPSGDYKVTVMAQDTNSLTGTLDNSFEYMALTAFEADFTSVNYGNVKLNINKIVNGDLNFGTADLPTVRNVGNTRMNLTVMQDDMGLGMTSGLYNVIYDARVGSFVDHQNYLPYETKTLDDALDLSETDEVDFSILVKKFPTSDSTAWIGNMTLGAVMADHLLCGEPGPGEEMRHISLENKNSSWEVLPDDEIFGDIDYSHNYNDFHGLVTGQGLVPNGYYQITLNGPNTGTEMGCSFTNLSLGNFGSNAFESGFWDSASPDLSSTCTADDEEGLYNMNLVGDHYTFQADGSGDFSYPFTFALPAGDYVGVKVLVKKML
ncbi:hypothetical protein DRH27_04175, partial [Candidatus Falkowbacteria bacterium]